MAVARRAGAAAVSVGLSRQARSSDASWVQYVGPAEVEAVVPESGPAAGGSLLRLVGHAIPSEGAVCQVGADLSAVVGVTDGGAECVAPAGAPGFAPVSLEGVAPGAVVFQYREAAVVRSVAQRAGWVGAGVSFAREPQVVGASPAALREDGGSAVAVAGDEFSESVSLHCAFGSVAPVPARWVSVQEVECMAVAMRAGAAAVSVGVSRQVRSSDLTWVEYVGPAEVEAVVPESGPAAGGSLLRLVGQRIPSEGAVCQVGADVSAVVGVTGGDAECVAPAGAPGFSPVSLEGVAPGAVVFQYREPSVVRSVVQRAGWVGEGTVFHVAGSNLQASCSVEREPAAAHLVSTALAVCEAAWSEEGPATLRVGGSSEGAGVSFVRRACVAGASPAALPEKGGLLVSVSGEGFSDSVGLHCALGAVTPVQARVLGLEDAECMAVAMPAGPAAVAVGLSAQARSGGGARVEYLGAAQVEAVVPESGPAAGGSPLRLLGRELPSRGARCRVGG